MDDGCYVLVNDRCDGHYGHSPWIFPEALEALMKLPRNPRDAGKVKPLPKPKPPKYVGEKR